MQSMALAIEMSMASVHNWIRSKRDEKPIVGNKLSMPKMVHGIWSREGLPDPFDRHTSNTVRILAWRMKGSDIYPEHCNLLLENEIANPIQSSFDALTETQALRTIYCHEPGRKNCLLTNRLKETKIEKITLLSISAATISSWIWTIFCTATRVYLFTLDSSIFLSQFSFYSERFWWKFRHFIAPTQMVVRERIVLSMSSPLYEKIM